MKFLAITTLLLASVAAHAQSSATTLPTAPAPAAGTSSASATAVAPKKSVSVKLESYNASSPVAYGAKDGAWASENDIKITKKLDDSRSLRLDVGFVNEAGYDYNFAGKAENETYVKDTYVQYANTKAYTVGKQDLSQIFRVYLPTSKVSIERGAYLPQLRYYLSSDYAITEKFTISPTVNPRAYLGDASFTASNKPTAYTAGRIFLLVDFAYAFNDVFSYTFEPIHVTGWNYKGKQSTLIGFDNWLTAQITKDFAVTVGFDGLQSSDNNRTPVEYSSNSNEYYVSFGLNL